MANVPPPKGKGEPPPPADIVGNLDKPEPEEISNLNFKVPKSFHRELGILYVAAWVRHADRDAVCGVRSAQTKPRRLPIAALSTTPECRESLRTLEWNTASGESMPDGKRKPNPKKPDWDSTGMSPRAKAHFDKYVRWLKDDMSDIETTPLVAGQPNVIESAFSVVERVCLNVKRWHEGDQRERWVGSGLLVAEKQFRRVKGHKQIPILIRELEALAGPKKDVAKRRKAS